MVRKTKKKTAAEVRRERRQRMTEAERNAEREKDRISKRTRRGQMDPEERQRKLQEEREAKRLRRRPSRGADLRTEDRTDQLEPMEEEDSRTGTQKCSQLLQLPITASVEVNKFEVDEGEESESFSQQSNDHEQQVYPGSLGVDIKMEYEEEAVDDSFLADLTYKIVSVGPSEDDDSVADEEYLEGQKLEPDETTHEWAGRVATSRSMVEKMRHPGKRPRRTNMSAAELKRVERARMTEEERNAEKERDRTSKRIRRALMDPEERKQKLKNQREAKRRKRIQAARQSMEEKLKIIQYRLENLKGCNADMTGAVHADEEMLNLEKQKCQLEQKMQTLLNTLPKQQIRRKVRKPQETEDDEVEEDEETRGMQEMQVEGQDEEAVDPSELSDQTIEVAEGTIVLSSTIFEEQDNPKMRVDAFTEEWVETINDGNDSRKGRLAALKARATLIKLQRCIKRGATEEEKAERKVKISLQQKFILELMKKYPEEFYVRQARAKKPAGKRQPVQNKRNQPPHPHRFKFPISLETPEERINRIAKIIEIKGKATADFDKETPVERAVKIVAKVEEMKATARCLKQSDRISDKKLKAFEREREMFLITKSFQTLEEQAEQRAKAVKLVTERFNMEREELRIFQAFTSSDNPSKFLREDESAPKVFQFWDKFKYKKKSNAPECLIQWRTKVNSFLSGTSDEVYSLQEWMTTNFEPLNEFLTIRKNKRFKKVSKVSNEKMREWRQNQKQRESEEQKQARRNRVNEYKRKAHVQKKLQQGIVITPRRPRGERSLLSLKDTPRPTKQNISKAVGGTSSSTVTENDKLTTLGTIGDVTVSGELDDDDDGDDWTPQYMEYASPNPNHNQLLPLGSQYVNQPSHHQANGNPIPPDELFHRLIQFPPQQNLPHAPIRLSNASSTQAMHFEQHHAHQATNVGLHPWFSNSSQPIQMNTPFDYSMSYQANSQQLTETVDMSAVMMMGSHLNHHSNTTDPHYQPEEMQTSDDSNSDDGEYIHKRKAYHNRVHRSRGRPRKIKPTNSNDRRPRRKKIIPVKEVPVCTPLVLNFTTNENEQRRTCSRCSRVLQTQFKYDLHIKKCQIENTVACKLCPQIFDEKSKLGLHIFHFHQIKMFQCPVCSRKYNSKSFFIKHLTKHPSSANSYVMGTRVFRNPLTFDKFWCDVCHAAFDSLSSLIAHRQAHKCECKACGIILNEAEHLIEHTTRCHPQVDWKTLDKDVYKTIEESVFTCKTCRSVFCNKDFLAQHKAEGHPLTGHDHTPSSGSTPITCDYCTTKFRRISDRDLHTTKCPLLHFKCYWCSELSSSEDHRLRHITQVHHKEKSIPGEFCTDYKNMKCEFCRRAFSSIIELRYHFTNTHVPSRTSSSKEAEAKVTEEVNKEKEDSTPTTKVIETGQEIRKDKSIPQPMTAASESDSRAPVLTYPCHLCKSNYKTNEFREKHIATDHANRTWVVCDICNKSLSDAQTLYRHKKALHDPNKKIHQCPQCPAKLQHQAHLRKHIKRVHENPDPVARAKYVRRLERLTKPRKKFNCEVCSASLFSQNALNKHQSEIHFIGVVPFFCEICGKQLLKSGSDVHSVAYHMQKFHPQQQHEQETVTYSSQTQLRTILTRLPLPDVLQHMDEIYNGGRSYKKDNSRRFRKKGASEQGRGIKKAKFRVKRKGQTEISETSGDDEEEWISGPNSIQTTTRKTRSSTKKSPEFESEDSSMESSDWDEDSSSNEEDSVELDSGQPSHSARRPKISMRNVVIKPKRKPEPSHKRIIERIPVILVERCDELVKNFKR